MARNLKAAPRGASFDKKKDAAPRPFLPPASAAAATRQLEYRVSITLDVTNLAATRRQLLELIPRYGFLLSSSWHRSESRPTLSLSLRVDSAKLSSALTEIGATGTLISERITVTDHTEEAFISSIRAARSALRIRRDRLRQHTDSQRQDYRADEDASDNEKIRKWRINDRVRWATVTLSCRGPEKPATIRVPSLQRTLVDSLNSLLAFAVGLIPAIPFLLLCLWIWIKRNALRRFFTSKGKETGQKKDKEEG